MKSAMLILVLCSFSMATNLVPSPMDPHIAGAKALLNSKHEVVELWSDSIQFGKTYRSPKPINTKEDFQAILMTMPASWGGLYVFGDVVEHDGWFGAGLVLRVPEPKREVTPASPLFEARVVIREDKPVSQFFGMSGFLVKKGSAEICPFIEW